LKKWIKPRAFRKILDAGTEGLIQKPFLIAALAEKLEEVLERE